MYMKLLLKCYTLTANPGRNGKVFHKINKYIYIFVYWPVLIKFATGWMTIKNIVDIGIRYNESWDVPILHPTWSTDKERNKLRKVNNQNQVSLKPCALNPKIW